MRRWLLAGLLLAAGCPQQGAKPECEKAADCAAEDTSACNGCPTTATTMCAGGKCEDRPANSVSLRLDLSMPRNVAIKSSRIAVIHPSAADMQSCATGECPAAVVTCSAIQSEGMDAARFNRLQSAAKNTDTAGGATLFPDVSAGEVPAGKALVAVEGRSGTLGQGDVLAFGCTEFEASGSSADVALTLQAN
ncbi:MAG: hypothetical protein AB2A00_42100 [Myxococcota bacterium]